MKPDGGGRFFPIGLVWKLLAINVPIIAAVIVVVWLTIDYLAADYFASLMERYNISPAETHQMFLDAIHRYLIQASIIALVLASGLSFLFTRKALRPLSEMAEVTRRIASGDYAARVGVTSRDEVGRLGEAFNRMADSLTSIENLRKRMVADIAHELRTPLTNIRGYVEGLEDGVVPKSRENFEIVEQEILRLVRLVEDLQQLTQAEAARAYLTRDELDLPELVSQALELDRPHFAARRISVETDIGEGCGRIVGDRDRLLRVLRNLIQNAWQHTPEGGAFRIAAERGEGGVTLTFANTGAAIAEEDLPHLFERFWRADASRSRDSGGSGIGLAIVRELVEAHGGRVAAELGDGEIRFRITLPD